MIGSIGRGSGTGTTYTGTGTHIQYTFGTGTTFTCTGTNKSFLRDLSRIPILVQGYNRLSATTLRSLRKRVFKPYDGVREAVLDSRVWF